MSHRSSSNPVIDNGGSSASRSASFGARARQAVAWNTGFNLFRDALQFAVMLVLVRLLPAEVYGQFGFLTALISFLTLCSFREFLNHTLQIRDGEPVPYQDHFTAGLVIQGVVFAVANGIAFGLARVPEYAAVAPVLHVMSVLFLLDLPSELRVKMLERALDWRRLRLLHASALVAASLLSVVLAFRGWGVYALLLPTLVVPLPFIYDLLVRARWRPSLSWSWSGFEPASRFGASRILAASLVSGAALLESWWLSWGVGFAMLGIFGRAVGLAQLLCGRLAGMLAQAVYPVLTRMPVGSDVFRRAGAMYVRAIAWVVVPGAALATLLGDTIVRVLYGERWLAVVPLLGFALSAAAAGAIAQTAYTLLLAHGRQDRCLAADAWRFAGTILSLALLLPYGLVYYLAGMTAVHASALAAIVIWLRQAGALTGHAVAAALVPPAAATLMALAAIVVVRWPIALGGSAASALSALVFAAVVASTFRFLFPRELTELVGCMPEQDRLTKWLRLPSAA